MKCIQSTHKLEDLSWPDEGNQILSHAPPHRLHPRTRTCGSLVVSPWVCGCVLPGLDSSKSKSSQEDTEWCWITAWHEAHPPNVAVHSPETENQVYGHLQIQEWSRYMLSLPLVPHLLICAINKRRFSFCPLNAAMASVLLVCYWSTTKNMLLE